MRRWRSICCIILVGNGVVNLFIFLWVYGSSNKNIIIEEIRRNANSKKLLIEDSNTKGTDTAHLISALNPTYQTVHLTTIYHSTTTIDIPTHIKKSLLFKKWHLNKISKCDGDFQIHNNEVIIIENAYLNKLLVQGNPGGEDVKDVINQSEKNEFYHVDQGFMQLSCKPSYYIPSISYQDTWLRSIIKVDQTFLKKFGGKLSVDKTLTILLVRFEYANVYWSIMDLYNLFIVLKYLQKSPKDADLLILDGHPKTSLDDLWTFSFKKVLRVNDLEDLTFFSKIVWNIDRKISPLLAMNPTLPFAAEFRTFVLHSFGISEEYTRNCQNLKILFVWRRDYINHPRNPHGSISRKVTNEKEIISAVKKQFPHFNITESQLDRHPVKSQLSLISGVDILIGMHGAAFGFTGFLPPKSALVELFPHAYGHNWHFEYLAKWNNVYYHKWENTFPDNEDHVQMSTIIPPDIINNLITDAAIRICPILRNTFLKTVSSNLPNKSTIKNKNLVENKHRVVKMN